MRRSAIAAIAATLFAVPVAAAVFGGTLAAEPRSQVTHLAQSALTAPAEAVQPALVEPALVEPVLIEHALLEAVPAPAFDTEAKFVIA